MARTTPFRLACLLTSAALFIALGPVSQASAHTVLPGESFWSIAVANGVTPYALAAANGRSITSTIFPGDLLQVPVATATAAPSTSYGTTSAYGFVAAPGTNYLVGSEPALVARLNTMGQALHIRLTGISGYRTPGHSVEVGGFANDAHTRGEASDTLGVEAIPEATLERFGLTRPFLAPSEADHIQLLG